ncbi:hypothetical protein PHLCEN_2v13058 [Hermanssonia centrifuga]|uniref:SAM-dependent methyltransferase TRM5/TYW2-type domain-containing protein n=1 Tax=Hermanssonia centrifuga TaxID=98765 RepID=A0A2R6NFN0_9APHY|nr:hypothetical protein PHLCEN_2v13058 [Hermanssonia centrifuga]
MILSLIMIIGQQIAGSSCEQKNIGVRTVVNKLNTINNKFRVFQMELLAGEPDFIVQHWETNCKFTFDFTKVYWNSRLHTEHARLVDKFTPEDVIADVFAGVGPFAVPAAKKGCGVLANDLNPSSHEYLQVNISGNNVRVASLCFECVTIDFFISVFGFQVGSLVRASCQDGREFIRSVITRALDEPLPPAAPPLSKSKETKAKKLAKLKGQRSRSSSPERIGPQRNRVTQFVMNLPDSAIQFIDAFRGVLSPTHTGGRDLSGIYDDSHLPMVHCYCFTRELELDKAEVDIRQVSTQ